MKLRRISTNREDHVSSLRLSDWLIFESMEDGKSVRGSGLGDLTEHRYQGTLNGLIWSIDVHEIDP